MKDLLTNEKQEFLRVYSWIKDYAKGLLNRENFQKYLEIHITEFKKNGFNDVDMEFLRNSHLTKDMILERLQVMLTLKRVVVLPEMKNEYTVFELKEMFSRAKLCVCDFKVTGMENGHLKKWGLLYEDITIIDHHAPLEEFGQRISSTILANNYVLMNGPLPTDFKIFINHMDCDSILSMLIMAGILYPDEKFGDAAISADHTGTRNEIADVLQSFQNENDLVFSVKNLAALLHGKSLDERAQSLLIKREEGRNEIKLLISEGKFKYFEDIAYVILDKQIEGVLVPPMLPNAKIIVIAAPMPARSFRKWNIKVRLGVNAPGIQLNKLDLPDWGGRWNAGTTKRHGGTDIEPAEYAKIIFDKINS